MNMGKRVEEVGVHGGEILDGCTVFCGVIGGGCKPACSCFTCGKAPGCPL